MIRFQSRLRVYNIYATTNENLSTHWQGPYQVLKLIGKVDYLVDMHDHRNRRKVLHVNLLRKWCVRESVRYLAKDVDKEDQDIPAWKEMEIGSTEQPAF